MSFFCLAAGLVNGQTAADSARVEMERQFQAAMAAEDKGDLVQAESLLMELRTKQPGIFAVDESLGLLFVGREKFAEALPLLESAAREEPSSDVAHANLGAAYFKLHRNLDALTEFQRAAQLNPRNAETQQALGQLWMETSKPERAAEAFAAALAQKPGDAGLLMNRAQALKDAGHAREAAQSLTSLPGANQSAPAQLLLGDVNEELGDFGKAGEHYARAVELDPSEANVWTLGREFLRHWTFEAAIREFEAAAVKFPQSSRIRLGLGAAYYGNGGYGQAVPVFADLLQTDPDNGLYAGLLGLSCTAATQGPKPRCNVLLTYAQSHPDDAKASTYAATMIQQGVAGDDEIALARKLLKSAIKADPRLAEAQFQMAFLRQNQADWPGSIPYLERAIVLRPDNALAHYRLALAYWRSGRKEEGQVQMDLQKKLHKQQQDDLDQRLRQITTFLVNMHD